MDAKNLHELPGRPERSNSRQFPAGSLVCSCLGGKPTLNDVNDPMVHDVSVPPPTISNGNISPCLNHFFGVVRFGERLPAVVPANTAPIVH